MFDHTHYVPILKAKQGEFGALEDLTPEARGRITPVLEVPPIPWDWKLDAPAKSIDSHLDGFAAAVVRAWGVSREFFLDGSYLEDEGPLADGRSATAALLDDCRAAGLQAIPVTGPNRGPAQQHDVAAAVGHDGRGACIRLAQDDLADLLAVDQSIEELLGVLTLSRSDADLLLDFEQLAGNQVPTVTLAAIAVLATLRIDDWRTVTVAAAGFPETLSAFAPNSISQALRSDWAVWSALRARQEALSRLPTFGDYGIAGAQLSEIDPRVMQMSANLRYTGQNEWTVLKGRGVRKFGFAQFNDLCRNLVARPEFQGQDFSAGDRYIKNCADGAAGPGNAMSWRRCGTNHHLTFAANQIASLFGP